MKAEEVLIYLASCLVNDTKPNPDRFSDVSCQELIYLAEMHQMSAIAATGLKLAGVKTDFLAPDQLYNYIYIDKLYDSERSTILNELEKNKIWYMPLKGTILKTLYPQPFLRQMSDNDILFDAERADDVREIMTSLGYATEIYNSGHRDAYRKQACYFEMHRVLIDEEMLQPVLYDYYSNIKERMIKDSDNQYGYHLSDEDYYIFMIAHEYKHFAWAGTGIRSLLDVYVYLKDYKEKLNWSYVEEEIKKLELSDFEKENRELAINIFSDGNTDKLHDDEKKMLDYYAGSGVYGKTDNIIVNQVKKEGKIRYILHRAFLPMDLIEKHYPFFYKHKTMIPVLPLYRLIYRWKSAVQEIKRLRRI